MFAIHYTPDFCAPQQIKRDIKTLAEARDQRIVSGDLVVHQETGQVVTNPEWLWDWERGNTHSYAYRTIQKGT